MGLVVSNIADGLVRGAESIGNVVTRNIFEPRIRLGVTGLSRAGKTVFITSLVANLMDRARMGGLKAAADGIIEAAYLQPQPNDTIPRFAYEEHLAAMIGPTPHWPESTRAVSELRLSLKVRPGGLMGAISGPRVVHLDIVDYPGEWLLDLALLDQSYEAWSALALKKAQARTQGAEFITMLGNVDGADKLEEPQARQLAESFANYLKTARGAGFSDCTPGRFLLPGELEGSPALTFAPLPPGEAPRGSLQREMARRFEAYKSAVVKPFFKEHFSQIDRQVVLVDVLGAIHAGPQTLEDLRQAMAEILDAFRPGRNSWLAWLLGGHRVEKILFAATKADHLHHRQHSALTAITEALLRETRDRADFAGAKTAAMSIAALRATVEETRSHEGREIDLVRGCLEASGKQVAMYPGELPEDPGRLLGVARKGQDAWLDGEYAVMKFSPAEVSLSPGEGPPHIRLDRAAEFLIGDRLR